MYHSSPEISFSGHGTLDVLVWKMIRARLAGALLWALLRLRFLLCTGICGGLLRVEPVGGVLMQEFARDVGPELVED
jgi:hypothetical protein